MTEFARFGHWHVLGEIVYEVGLLKELKNITDLQESRRSAGLTTEAEAERIHRAIFGV